MTAFEFTALGPGFEARWKRAAPSLRRDVLAELRAIYRFLSEDDDIPVLDLSHTPAAMPQPMAAPNLTPRPDNPFLPKSLLDRLHNTQAKVDASLPTPGPALSNAQLEQELRQRLSPMVEQLLDEHLHSLRGELRFRLSQELERLIQDQLKSR